jgi:hypothetical protein
MSDKTKHSRRRLLRAVAGAGGLVTAGRLLPETWTRPVVDAVSLPAHAQTSGSYYGVVPIPENEINGQIQRSLIDLIIPAAHAQEVPRFALEAHICVIPQGDSARMDVVTRQVLGPNPNTGILHSGVVPIDGSPANLAFVDSGTNCIVKAVPLSVQLDSLAKGRILDFGGLAFDLPQQGCNLPGLGFCKEAEPA